MARQNRPTAGIMAGSKRKMELENIPNEVHKLARTMANGNLKGKQRATEEGDVDARAAGPSLPDGDEMDYDVGDEEGRFFGGGVTKDTEEILDFMDQTGDDDVTPEKIDRAWLRKFALGFERRISTNAELRAKFESEPERFMTSEADLDAEIKGLSILTEHPDLYPEFVRLGCVNSLVGLVSHENTDIAIDAIQIISELTDEDVQTEVEQWDQLANAMLEADVLQLLVQNFSRLDEKNETDRSGIYHSLSVLENFASKSSIAERVGHETSVLSWLLKRMQHRETPVGQNKQYSAEVLEILLQSSEGNRRRLSELDGIDALLQILSAYRKKDPERGSDEQEFMENTFGCLICMVHEPEGKQSFVSSEGVELCLIMLKEGRMSKPRALRLLDHALQGPESGTVCETLVEAAGLKTIFGMLMKKQSNQVVEHILGILAALLQYLPAESAARIRTLAKLVEKEYEKVKRILQIRQGYAARLGVVDEEIKSERAAEDPVNHVAMEEDWLSRRLDAGLFNVQTIDLILAWLIAEDDGAKAAIRSLLLEQGSSLATIKASLQEQAGSVADSHDQPSEMKQMLYALLRFL